MLEKLSKQLVGLIIEQCKEEGNRRVIKNTILDPLVVNILMEMQPFIIAAMIYFISTFIAMVILITIILSN